MALSLAAATIGSALIGGGTALYSANQASKANKKATQAQLEAQARQEALLREMNQPFLDAGYGALAEVLFQLGLGSDPSGAGGPDWDGYLAANPDAQAWVYSKLQEEGGTPTQWAEEHWRRDGERREVPVLGEARERETRPDPVAPTDLGAGGDPYAFGPIRAPEAYGAFTPQAGQYEESPEYKVKQDRIVKAVNAGYAAKGLLRSGAAAKGLTDRSGEAVNLDFGNWWDRELQKYETNRSTWLVNSNQYNKNRDTVLGQFRDDRDYDARAYDLKFDNLLRIAGIGQGAANALTGGVNTTTQRAADAQSAYYGAQGHNSADLSQFLGGTLQNLLRTATSRPMPTIPTTKPLVGAVDYGPKYRFS